MPYFSPSYRLMKNPQKGLIILILGTFESIPQLRTRLFVRDPIETPKNALFSYLIGQIYLSISYTFL